MLSNQRTVYVIMGQVIFSALFVWYFIQNSFLRPDNGVAMECGIALILVAAMAVNYWLLYPIFFKRHSFWLYALVTIAETALIASIEYRMTIEETLRFVPLELTDALTLKIKSIYYFNLLLRDTCLVAFAGLMADHLGQKFRLLDTDYLMLKRKGQMLVQLNGKEDCIIDANSISYVRQNQNYTYIYTIDGEKYTRRGTLNYFEMAPEELQGVKISRNTIVFMPYVQAWDNEEVTVMTMKSPCKFEKLPIGKTIATTAMAEMQKYQNKVLNESDISENVVNQDASETEENEKKIVDTHVGKKKPERQVKPIAENKKVTIIREFIFHHPDCNIHDIVNGTKIPKSTVTRYLKELRSQNLVKYVGAKKNGGYRVEEQQQMPV